MIFSAHPTRTRRHGWHRADRVVVSPTYPPIHTCPPQKFKLNGLTEEATIAPYDGAAAYSLHHRARVMLTELWAKELEQDK